jgi:uncharacterized protein YpuA (DUF1002 family)
LKRDITDDETDKIESKINSLPYIESVVYKSKMELSKEMMDSSEVFSSVMKEWDEGSTPIQATFQVKVKDINEIKYVADEIAKMDGVDIVKYGEGMVEQLVSLFDMVRKISIGMVILSIIIIGMLIPAGFSTNDDQVVITYGETTQHNANYKTTVDTFFKNQAGIDLNGVSTKVITADEVNKISSTITGKYYNSEQIFSSALVDLNDNDNLEVSVDKSTITTITGDMYLSALKSAGITSGHVYVTSPVTATGESALAGIMNSYEVATDVEIPDTVKEAANNEIYTQAEIVKTSNVSADDLSKLVDDVKETVQEENVTDHQTIVNIINNYTVNYNVNITDSDIENLADSIEQIQNVQGDINNYQTEVSDVLNSTDNESVTGFIDGLFN